MIRLRHSGAPQSGERGIDNLRVGTMDSGFADFAGAPE